MIKDISFNKIIKYKKYKDLYDRKTIEVKAALMGACLISILIIICIYDNTLDNINNIFSALTKDIAIALIGFLGFTVAGLAILTGVISKKEVMIISQRNKVEVLERILLSFYLLGITTAVAIVGLFSFFIISSSNLNYYIVEVAIITFILSYIIIFIIFYAVKLIGNCLEIFFIVNGSLLSYENKGVNVKELYNSYRLTALETVCLKKMEEQDVNESFKKLN